ncbi:MAG: DUF2892 domain-containing protein [Spirochaetia bacterium]|nr:DUF2892 domain-containing protein [Spirochaetia bacterium]
MYCARTDTWYLERVIWLVAGIFALSSTLLGYFVNPYWFILTGLVGTNLIILSLTGFCPMAIFLRWIGFRSKIEKAQ